MPIASVTLDSPLLKVSDKNPTGVYRRDKSAYSRDGHAVKLVGWVLLKMNQELHIG